MRRQAALAAVLAITPLTATSAAAACAEAELAGNYTLYAFETRLFEAGWAYCNLTVDEQGTLRPGTTCRDSLGNEGSIEAGQLELSLNCFVSGTLTVQYPDIEVEGTIRHAYMSGSRDTFAGVGDNNRGGVFQFTALRREGF